MYYTKTFWALCKEAQFTKEILAIGVTQLCKANYATKGIYYQSFVCLSTGIERLEKLCLILDYYIQHHGAQPSEDYIRRYGHKIQDLYTACRKAAADQQIGFHFQYKMDESIRQSMICLLGDFAETSGRYSNINILLGKENKSNDCIEQWFHNVDMPLYNKHISPKRKAGIERRALAIGSILNQYSSTMFMAEDNRELTDSIEASRRTGIWEAVAPYRQLYMPKVAQLSEQYAGQLPHTGSCTCCKSSDIS